MNKNKITISVFSFSRDSLKMYGYIVISALTIFFIVLFLNGCSEDLGDNIYTEQEETVGEYITNNTDTYSEFTKMLEICGTMGLLKAYGKYTCFAPDDSAMYELYKIKGKTSVEDFHVDSIQKIVYDHIIKDYEVTSTEFVGGFLPYLTMSGRYINVSLDTTNQKTVYIVNTNSKINNQYRDIELHNGIVHRLSKVLLPTDNSLVEAIAGDPKFSLFHEALIETGLYARLLDIRDDDFVVSSAVDKDGTTDGIGGKWRIPREKKYGFTALMESDETYEQNGIYDLDDLKAHAKKVYDEIYPDDSEITDPTDSSNSLNRFIAYHLVNKKITKQLFIEKYDQTGREYEEKGTTHSVQLTDVDMYEYIETMCPNTLIEVRTLRIDNEYNVFNMIESGEAIRLTDDYDNDALNGVYHEIDDILVYSTEVDRMLSSKRLRMDAASFFPELTNNNMRVGHASPDVLSERWEFPEGYFERVETSPNTTFIYINADDRFCDYQGDEVFLTGLYDFEITTPPIPAGTYEVRFGYQPTGNRGIAQLYWDGVPTGIPLNLSILADDARIGHETPGEDSDDPDGFENDKMMRNRGYMKGPACYQVVEEGWYSGTGRESASVLRRILGIYTFTEAGNHVFKVTAVKQGEFMFDYLEFVPVEVLEYEDIY